MYSGLTYKARPRLTALHTGFCMHSPLSSRFCPSILLLSALLSAFVVSSAWAGDCLSAQGPDVVVGDLTNWSKWGTVGGISAYSIGTTSCNRGDEILPWIANSNQHPVIAQNMYRLKNGRFEQIGMSWLKHGWGALTENLCCTCINPQ